jgi:hypothetical protein
MAKQVYTSITINSSPSNVWKVLTEFANYSNWNTFITSVQGDLKVGKRLVVRVDKMKFKPVVLQVIENSYFSWKGSLGFKGLFDGTHSFELNIIQMGQLNLFILKFLKEF